MAIKKSPSKRKGKSKVCCLLFSGDFWLYPLSAIPYSDHLTSILSQSTSPLNIIAIANYENLTSILLYPLSAIPYLDHLTQGGAIRAFFSRPVRPKIDPSDANCYQIGSTGIPVEWKIDSLDFICYQMGSTRKWRFFTLELKVCYHFGSSRYWKGQFFTLLPLW